MAKSYGKQSRLPRAKGMDMAQVYAPGESGERVKHMVFHPVNQVIVEEFMACLGMREQFAQYGVSAPNKLVMFGPPGTGKTLTAFYIAHRLELPLVLVRLDAIIHSHLGETGSNVRKVFDYARETPCVLFLDEFDALARTRDNNDEVKEMSRVVNTLLQCLDAFEGKSIFMAATNLEDELDHAVWRRFDTRMTYTLPDEKARWTYTAKLIGEYPCAAAIAGPFAGLTEGCSFADLEQVVLKAMRKAIIARRSLQMSDLDASLAEYRPHALAAR
ncbi:ATP-binding protein [Paenibacillus sp. IB182496]|uniref:ATP-binding protein n=1 Tax=Paenibacillus sabuli TaxID=2772509 RepID=A0A927BX73_9BACL|nr:ATP-binding protein [Paenibacillus sabuli]MBD2847385.1 ATP-binding protein [Paenibacillus sabuli]